MKNKYDSLFRPFKIGNMTVKNRLVMSPVTTMFNSRTEVANERTIDYYAARAKGGAGMLITEAWMPNPYMSPDQTQRTIIGQITQLAEAVQAYGCRLCVQMSAGPGRIGGLDDEGNPPVSASAIPANGNPNLICHEMTVEEIHDLMTKIRTLAAYIAMAGADCIEIHAHNGYLIDQFMTDVWNKRTDEYGGSLENRMRFPLEMIQAIREGTGGKLPVIFRITCDQRAKGERTIEDTIPMLKILQDAGVDALDVDSGTYDSIDWIFPPYYLGDACMTYVARAVRKAGITVPILNSGTYTPDTAVKAIENGDTDFVMMGRPLVADPELPNKLMRGCSEDVRPCLCCNEYCVKNILMRRGISCAVNPQTGAEKRFALKQTDAPKKVVVIGGGPGGLEAARVAATKGHQVILLEKEADVGGTIRAAATPDFKAPLRRLIDWYKVQLSKLSVDIRFDYEASADMEMLEEADQIIVATGSNELIPPISGVDGENVIGVCQAHLQRECVRGTNIVIAGGGLSGCDLALELTSEGKKVTVVEMRPRVAADVFPINLVSLMRKLMENGVTLLTDHRITEITSDGVTALHGEEKVLIPADTVITAFGTKPNRGLADELLEKYPFKTRLVGDCERTGKVGMAVRAGFFAGFAID